MEGSNLSSKTKSNSKKPTWPPPAPGGYPSIKVNDLPTIKIKSSVNKDRSKTNTGSRRSLNTDMSSLARKNMRRKNRRETVKAKPAGSNPQGKKVVARITSAAVIKRKKCKSKKRKKKSTRRNKK